MLHDEVQENLSKIVELTEESGRVNVLFKVISRNEPRVVTSRKSGRRYQIAETLVADDSARILLTLWNEEIDLLDDDKVYLLKNGEVQVYDYSMRLVRSLSGELVEMETRIADPAVGPDMSKPFMGRKKKRGRLLRGEGRTFHGTPGRRPRGYCSEKDF